jgi:flavin reductase (DIM6/NTAB) family NADH-FMN oxidoreductase RutF
MFYDAVKNDHGLPVDPIKSIVAPRPIGWVSTMDVNGNANLAPYSFFNLVAANPHYVAFGSSGYKHTLANINATGEFAVNIVTHGLREQMNASSASFPAHIDEFEAAGLAKAPCEFLRVMRVAESLAALECKLHAVHELPDHEGHVRDWLVVGKVLGVHIADSVIQNGRVATALLRPVARLGYSEYVTVDQPWRLRRPD